MRLDMPPSTATAEARSAVLAEVGRTVAEKFG
jgi:hypothetical protein